MDTLKIVVWDNIGNTLLGMRAWETWPPAVRERLAIEDPDARARVQTLDQVLEGHPHALTWLYDPVKAQRGFGGIQHEFGARLVETTGPDVIARELEDADFVVIHKETLPGEALEGATQVRLLQHLGFDYRGVPMEVARQRGIPVAATPLVNYSAVAEHVWAVILGDLKRLADQREYMQSRAYRNEWGAYHPGVQIVSDLTLRPAWARGDRAAGGAGGEGLRHAHRVLGYRAVPRPGGIAGCGIRGVGRRVRAVRCALGAAGAERADDGHHRRAGIRPDAADRAVREHGAREAGG